MLRHPTLDLLHELRLSGMAQAFEEQAAMPDIAELSFDDRLSLLLEREKTEREQRRYVRLKGLARLHLDATIEDLNFKAPRGLDRSFILRLAPGQWIRDGQTVLVSGATGSGKSYLACALGHQACRLGGLVRAGIPAGNHVKSYRTARSAFSAVQLDPTGPCRESGKTGPEWRDSRRRRTLSEVPETNLSATSQEFWSSGRISGPTCWIAAPEVLHATTSCSDRPPVVAIYKTLAHGRGRSEAVFRRSTHISG